MKHRFLMTALAAITLASGVGTATVVNTAQPVQAISKHSYHWHKVHTTKKVKIIRVNAHKPRYKWRALETVTLPKNSDFKIRYFGNDHYFQLSDLGIEFSGTWICRGSSTNWFKNDYKKASVSTSDYQDDFYDPHWNGNTYTVDDGSKITVNGLTKVTWGLGYGDAKAGYILLNITLKYNSTTPRVADNYFNKNFYLYPEGKSYEDYLRGDRTIILADFERAPQYKESIKAGGKTISDGQERTFSVPFELDDAFINDSRFTIEDLYGQKKTFNSQNINI